MAEAPLSPAGEKALRDLGTAARRLDPRFVPPMGMRDAAAAKAWVDSVRQDFRTARRKAEADLAVAEAQIQAAKTTGGSDAAWRALEDACRRIEQELTKPTSLRIRLDEGRRSLLPKVEKIIVEHLEPKVTASGGHHVGNLDPAGLEELKGQAPLWVGAWVDYVYPRLDEDLSLLVEELWHPRHGDLPLPPPRFEPFQSPRFTSAPDLPNVEVTKEAAGGLGGLLRHMRSVMYSVMSVGFMFGLSLRPSANTEWDASMICVSIGVVGAAFSFGVLQNSTERARLEERLAEEVQRRGEQAVRESVRVWLDRRQDKIVDNALDQYRERRTAFVRWYRETVLPAEEMRQSEARKAAQRADSARKSIVQLQATARDYATARQALEALDQALGA